MTNMSIAAMQAAGAMMNVPHGRVLTITYRAVGNIRTGGQAHAAIRVRFRTPNGEIGEYDLPNSDFDEDNPTLQFFAACGLKPSDFDGTQTDIRDKDVLIPLVWQGDEAGYAIHQNVLARGKRNLERVEWFDTMSDLRNDVVEVDVGGEE